ncbi:Phosphatidylinositol 3,4,5-trisphosphate-dependent Rac exchanger 2 protein, variant 2 [Entomophthora muscae]|uniref:Phosphatidylinositol 3,4,5-trisphosphate-dependent Rac exchanger 2 protein, variant 2 n=1 Tax=Entomophthora muscae TaxID=34485 RepID=A0ACC2TB24_9FUNG|nr:Phosphatidylinositol 3,4,5-trisphosphate-dependent Rac exchanger 2 protein, variant 2 [Entomophthora muscae]
MGFKNYFFQYNILIMTFYPHKIFNLGFKMTGLDLTKDKIIEVAAIITDKDLNVIAEGPNLIIHQPAEIMNNMNDWCKEHHGKCGLTAAVLASKLTIEEAEEQILSFVKKHVIKPKIAVLAGNSVHVDRSFLAIHMPRLIDHLHYRIIDVSTIKELARRWYPECLANAPTKKLAHRALEDVKESIIELRYYKKHFFLPLNESSYSL